MALSPDPQKGSKLLYASARRGVILGLVAAELLLAGRGWAQFGRKPAASKGPRAIGLVELSANGKGRLVPIAILYEGQYYDAGSYKASPVPMALDSGTVYEAARTGVSQGLFTISGALHSSDNRWIGAGTWQPAGAVTAKKAASPKKKSDDDLDAPPVLHRPGPEKAKSPEPPSVAKASAPTPAATATQATSATPPAAETAPAEDPDRPVLRRGRQSAASAEEPEPSPVKALGARSATAAATPPVQEIPAVSDANGPESHSYAYPTKPEEERAFHTKMLAMAATELQNYQKTAVGPGTTEKPSTKRVGTRISRPPQPNFEDVQLKILDLSTSNEPVLVLTAKALPAKASATLDLQYFVTLIAREDIYGDLHKASSKITDTQHLDSLPRLELIDAVDADGDGRGELLFRQISDAGKAFVIYRVIGDQLWPLYEGTPQ